MGLICLLGASLSANAYDKITEGVAVSAYDTVLEYTPATDGVLTVTLTKSWYTYFGPTFLFTNPNHSSTSVVPMTLENEGMKALFDVEGNKTYYFWQDQYNPKDFLNPTTCYFTFTLEGGAETTVALNYVYPEPGQAFTLSNYDLVTGIQVGFTPAGVSRGTAVMKYTDDSDMTQTVDLTIEKAGANWAIGGGFETQQEIYNNLGNVKKGTDFYIVLNDFTYNGKPVTEVAESLQQYSKYINIAEDGTVTLTFSRPANELTLDKAEWPQEIVPFFLPGNPKGYAVLTYSQPMRTIGTATLIFRNSWEPSGIYEDEFAQYDIPVTIEDNVVTLDLTGKDFETLQYYKAPANVHIFLAGIVANDGQPGAPINQTIKYNVDGKQQPLVDMSTPATVVNESQFVTSAQNLVLAWEGETISFTSETPYAWVSVNDGNQVQCSLSIENNQLSINLPEQFNAVPGLYTFTLPANMVKNAKGEVNIEQNFEYTLVEVDGNYTWSLKEGGNYLAEDLASVSISWDVEEILPGISSEKVSVVANIEEATPIYPEVTLSNGALSINLSMLDEGTYTLNIPEGYVWIEDGKTVNEAASLIFTVVSQAEYFTQGAVILPEDGNNYVLELEGLTLEWNDILTMEADAISVQVYVNGAEPVNVAATLSVDAEAEKTILNVDLSEFEDYGIYNVELAEGLLKDAEGKVNMTQSVEINYLAVNDNYTVTPEGGDIKFDALKDGIYIVWSNAKSVVLNETAPAITWANNNSPIYVTEAGTGLWIPGGELEKGEYTLIIPATKAVITGTDGTETLNDEIVVTYKVGDESGNNPGGDEPEGPSTGVSSLEAEASQNGVYNLNGVKVGSSLKGLNPGLYIVNGKKVVIK